MSETVDQLFQEMNYKLKLLTLWEKKTKLTASLKELGIGKI